MASSQRRSSLWPNGVGQVRGVQVGAVSIALDPFAADEVVVLLHVGVQFQRAHRST